MAGGERGRAIERSEAHRILPAVLPSRVKAARAEYQTFLACIFRVTPSRVPIKGS